MAAPRIASSDLPRNYPAVHNLMADEVDKKIDTTAAQKIWKPRNNRVYQQPGSVSSLALVLNRLYFMPLEIVDGTATLVAARVSTVAAAGGLLRLGLYSDVNGVPSDLLVDAGTVDATTVGSKSKTISQAVTGPIVWVGVVAQTAAPSVNASVDSSPYVGINGGITGGAAAAYFSAADDVSGALPTPAAIHASFVSSAPLVGLQVTPS